MRGWEGRLLHMEKCTFAWETQQQGWEKRHRTKARWAAVWDSLSCLLIWALTWFCAVDAMQSTFSEVMQLLTLAVALRMRSMRDDVCVCACLYALTAWKMPAPGTHSLCDWFKQDCCVDISWYLVIFDILNCYNFFTFFGCWDRVLLFRLGWPGTLCGYEVGLKFTELYLILYPKGWH